MVCGFCAVSAGVEPCASVYQPNVCGGTIFCRLGPGCGAAGQLGGPWHFANISIRGVLSMKIMLGKLFFAVLWALTSVVPQSLSAQSYPSKPIRLIVPFSAGGPTDVVARLVGQNLSAVLGESVVVENKPGASGFIGTEAVARAQPDGYTLLLITASTHAISPNLFKKLPYHPIKDFAMVGQFTDASLILVVSPSLAVNSVAELVSLAKSKPGKMNYASWGKGGAAHMAGELFKQATDTDMMHIPYKGSAPAITDLMSGQVSVFFDTITSSLPHARSGKLQGLAVT